MNGKDFIALELYETSSGLSLHIGVDSVTCLERLRAVFLKLADKLVDKVSVHQEFPIRMSTPIELFLRLGGDNLNPFRPFHVEIEDKNPLRIGWTESAECWLDCADFVTPLIEHAVPAHQYMTARDTEDIQIVLSFNE